MYVSFHICAVLELDVAETRRIAVNEAAVCAAAAAKKLRLKAEGEVFCSVLQYVAVGCSGLQWVAACYSVLQWVAVGCIVLQWVAACCRGLQCVLQCFAVCCSVYFVHVCARVHVCMGVCL